LYFSTSGRRLLFASDVFAVVNMLPTRPSPDPAAVARMLSTAMPTIEATPYAGVSRLTSGHLVELSRAGWKARRYWEPQRHPTSIRSRDEARDALWNAVEGAVSARLSGVERAGIIMSGGLDSSTVAAAAAGVATSELRGYSAVFPS